MATKNFNVNSSGYTAVTAASVCREIEVYENDQAGTTDYNVSATGNDSDAVTRPSGAKTLLRSKEYQPGQIAGYIKTATGSITFAQEERG